MFPTGVGMNRTGKGKEMPGYNVPHRRGDEPNWEKKCDFDLQCSPQAWG